MKFVDFHGEEDEIKPDYLMNQNDNIVLYLSLLLTFSQVGS